MPVFYAGDCSKAEEIYQIALEHNIRVVADAAHAFGSYSNSHRLIGSFGDITCFSFDGIKNITCGEGGCVTSSDTSILEHISSSRLLGVICSKNRYRNQRSWDFQVNSQNTEVSYE